MRNLIVFIVMLLSISTASQASDNPNYRSFNQFNNDTLAYLKYNFDGNEYYVGKTLNELFDDLEIPTKFYFLCPDFFVQNNLRDAILYFDDKSTVFRAINEKKSRLLLKLYISFQPICMKEYDQYELVLMKARDKRGANFDDEWELYGKSFLKNRIITKLYIPEWIDKH